ncbi:GNAT family N-acetyltransferase [Salisediminibacterium beveridgei]|uniref:Putative N-acetyltransferase YhdJ n=1 Tax=Salisediminibacterium beveridgei TaxID=632773 RepID=A0A1D7QYM1_9BACI|nr:GNAT family N-acetyltransferase [Salisediminibacterium beveridgei]AOM84078.1 putative N-acetyltransferase YhdJ [Salisediminibacterium beveridgei]
MSEISVIELTEADEFRAAFPVMRQLRTHLDEGTYLELVNEAIEVNGYRMFGLIVDDYLLAVTGFIPMTNLYDGRSIWICDLVTDQQERSKGYGEILLQFVQEWASDNGYEKIALSSGLQRTQSHRFYVEHMDYERASFVFKKDL